jgi:Flp pilus assembly pilin Flp
MSSFLRLCLCIRERQGQSTTEYVLIVTAVAIAAIVAYAALGTDVSQLVNNVSTSL